jgi:hypothetical protein
VQERIGGQHPLDREKKERGVDKGNDDRDLKEVEKDLCLYMDPPIRFG